jgi:pimeloyl-ACP methyl ester carboxylesterase
MAFLDWAENKLDRAIISIGELFKTWFQEVWRLVFRVVVFWLSILLGFIHKPSFEKWFFEQRGRIRPQMESLSPWKSDSERATEGHFAPEGGLATSNFGTSPLSPHSPIHSPDSLLGSAPSAALGPAKRKTNRTAFADLLHTPPLQAPLSSQGPWDTNPSPRLHTHRSIPLNSQPSSFSDEMDFDTDFSQTTPRGPHAHSQHAHTRRMLIPDDGEDDSDMQHAAATSSATHDDEDFDDHFDQHSSTSDDYDEFYGHKPKLTTSARNHSAPRPLRRSTSKGHARKSSASFASSPHSSGMHMFSMEDLDSSTSPLLSPLPSSSAPLAAGAFDETKLSGNSRNFEAGAANCEEVGSGKQQSRPRSNPQNISLEPKYESKGRGYGDEEGYGREVGGNRTHKMNLSSPASLPDLPPISDTSNRRSHRHIGESEDDGRLQAYSVPAELEPPLVSEKSKSRSSQKRARSMSPGGTSSRYSVTNPWLGGTGRRGTSKRRDFGNGPKQRYSTIDIHRDRIFASDKLNTGAMEDLRMWILLWIDQWTSFWRKSVKWTFRVIREFSIRNVIVEGWNALVRWVMSPREVVWWAMNVIWNLTFGGLIVLFYLPSRFIAGMKSSSFDKRTTEALVQSQGYPYETYEVVTDDGYILKLERLPRRKSNRVIYFQHGVVDNSFAWFGHVEGEAGSAVAFRAYDAGYDVFVGTFRGCEGSTRHTRKKDFTSSDYWNFSVNEHGMFDLKAFIDKIVSLKKHELGSAFEPRVGPHSGPLLDLQFDIMLIAHSMGAMASLIYLVWSKLHLRNHFISCAILLSPAGYHKTAPAIVNIMGPIINLALWLFPWIHTLKFPSETIRLLVSKILEDVNNSFTGRTMISWCVAKVIGGSIEDNTFVNLRNLTYNVFSGTSTGVFKHFWQCWIHKRFEGFDYGHSKNLSLYGTLKPIDFIDNYDKLDLPIYFVMGLNDTLIQPESIIYQYVSYKNVHPDLAFLKAFPRMGHIDFTVGASEKLIEFIMDTLSKNCTGERIHDDGEQSDEELPSPTSFEDPASPILLRDPSPPQATLRP